MASHESRDYRTVSLTSLQTGAVLDRQSPGWFPTSPGITGLRLSVPGWPVHSHQALPECRYHPHWLPPTPPESPDYVPHPPAGYSQSVLSAHSLTIACSQYVRAFTVLLLYTSELSPYYFSRYPGVHRTAVLLLTRLCTNMHPHGSSQHLYIDSHNTLYLLTKSPMCLSQDRSNN